MAACVHAGRPTHQQRGPVPPEPRLRAVGASQRCRGAATATARSEPEPSRPERQVLHSRLGPRRPARARPSCQRADPSSKVPSTRCRTGRRFRVSLPNGMRSRGPWSGPTERAVPTPSATHEHVPRRAGTPTWCGTALVVCGWIGAVSMTHPVTPPVAQGRRQTWTWAGLDRAPTSGSRRRGRVHLIR